MKTIIILIVVFFSFQSCKKCWECTLTQTNIITETVNPHPGDAWSPKTTTEILTSKTYPCGATKKDIKKLEQTQSETKGNVKSTITINCEK